MREESQIDEMRSAIRGDFERLADRRGEQELMRVSDGDQEDEEEEVLEAQLAPEPEHARRSWLARLFAP